MGNRYVIIFSSLKIPSDAFSFASLSHLQGPPPPPSSLDPAVVAAFIGVGGVILGALLAGLFALYQIRYQMKKNAQLEKEMERFRQALEEDSERKKREQQRQENAAEAANLAMLRARTLDERILAYRQALRADPRIIHLQILDMTQPLEVTAIYIRLRLHEESRLGYQRELDLQEIERSNDPNTLLKLGQKRLEQRASTALSPEETIQKYKRCVIVGDPGAGKSTLLKHLTLRSLDGQLAPLPNLPIHIELQTFATSGHRDLLEFISAQWEKRYGFPKADALDYLQTILQAGQALVLLDALDETVTGASREQAEQSYEQVSEAITNLATRYAQVPLVVTARKAGYHQHPRLPGFTEVDVLDFQLEDSIQFVQRWFAVHPNEQKRGNAPDLIARLERNPRVQALAANPLLLTLIVLVYEDQLDLPERRAELYARCVETLLTKWDASRNIRRRRVFKPEHKRQLLEELAWHFHLQGQRYFPESELLEQIATFLPAVGLAPEHNSQVLAEIAAENGLLKEQALGWHGFLHLTLQEYFVAQYMVDHQQLEALLAKRDLPWWEEVLLLYAGRVPDASPLLQYLLHTGAGTPSGTCRDDLFYTDLLLAGRCLATSPTTRQASLRTEIVARLFTVLQTSPYVLTQEQIATVLAEIGGTVVQNQFLGLLSNEQVNSTVRKSIAQALGALGERSVVPQLVELLSNDQVDSAVRGSIAQALGALGERSVAPQLVALLSNDQVNSDMCWSIADALGALGERSVAPQLVALLSNDQVNSYVRGSIAQALGALGERSVVPQLVELLSNEQVNSYARGSIAQALGALGERSVAPQLVALLSNDQVNIGVRRNIASALPSFVESDTQVQMLVELLLTSDIADPIHRELWTISRQLGVRIFVNENSQSKQVEVVRIGNDESPTQP